MADNHLVLEGDGTTLSTFSSKDISGVKHLKVMQSGLDGVEVEPATAENQVAGNEKLDAIAANQIGAAAFEPDHVTVLTSETAVVAARVGRRSVALLNAGPFTVRFGNAGLVKYARLPAGASVTIDTQAAIVAISPDGNQVIDIVETF